MPTGCLPKSAPNSSTASLGTIEAKFRPITCRKVASGRDSSMRTVLSSGVVTPDRLLAVPAAISSIAGDRAEEAGARALGLRVGDPVERIFHVRGGHRPAVVEFHAVAQLEGEHLAVRRDLIALGEVRLEGGRAGLVVHHGVEQALDHRPVLPVVADRRVERGDVVLVGDDDRAARLGFLAVGRRQRQAERERAGRCGVRRRFLHVEWSSLFGCLWFVCCFSGV